MPKELKERIYNFLMKNRGKRFSLREISIKSKISYPSVLKWSEVIIAEKRDPPILVEDRGNIKFLWIEK